MKCLYFLTPNLDSAHSISDDLHSVGVQDWYIHVISKDEAGLKKEHIHSSNYVETTDLMGSGLVGASVGFLVGVIGAVLLMALKPFGQDAPLFAYFAFVIFATLFGSWVGGLIGVATENKKLTLFHDDIEAGKYLFLIYTRKGKEEAVKAMMREQHPESEHVATDEHFISPLRIVTRETHTGA